MAKNNNEFPALVASLLLTVALLSGGAWWLSKSGVLNLSPGGNPGQTGTNPNNPNGGQSAGGARLSTGQISFIANSAQKQAGSQAFAQGDFNGAMTQFQSALQAQRNDPEALIYLNNAEIGKQKSYTIAVAVPIVNEPNPSSEILRGVAQAQAEVNRTGGINGVPLKVLIVNDDNKADIATQLATQLVNDQSVLGVVGHFSSGTSLAAAKVYEPGQLPMISPISTAVALSDAGDYIYRTVPSDRLAANTLAKYQLDTLKVQKVAVFFSSQSTYSQSIKSEFATAILSDGGEVVAEVDLSAPNFNAEQALQSARQQQAEAIMLGNDIDTLDQALAVVNANQQQLPIVAGDDLYNPKVLQVGGANTQNMVIAVPWHILEHLNSDFVRRSRDLWGGDVNWRTVTAYDATTAFIAALKQQPSRQGIQQVLSASGFDIPGATSDIKFFPSGDRNQPSQLVIVKPGTRSGYGYDFVPVP
jgi:branched-chain amino acid transport system substrate-binding protein